MGVLQKMDVHARRRPQTFAPRRQARLGAEAVPSGHPPVPLWPAAGQNQNITGAELQKLVEDMFPEVAGVWNFLDDDDLMVEWARYPGC